MGVASDLKLGQTFELSIDGLGHEGQGVGRWQDLVVFVPGALPRERVVARLRRSAKRHFEADLVGVEEPSEQRRKPEYVAPGGNAYGQKQRAQCLRDFGWYLRLVTYGVLAGSTEMIQKIGLEGAREMYNSLGVPMPGMVESMRCLKEASLVLLNGDDASLAAPYFDFLIQGMQTPC